MADDRITVCIATIPPRAALLRRALASVVAQTHQPAAVVVEYDHDRLGAAATKNRALAAVRTPWAAFLDDDDQFLPMHLERLLAAAQADDADVVYSIPDVPQRPDRRDPCGRYGVPFDGEELRRRSYIQTTSLVRAGLMRTAGGFQCPPGSDYDDWGAWLALLDHGARFVHLPEVTFIWNHWGPGRPGVPGNTSGRADRW